MHPLEAQILCRFFHSAAVWILCGRRGTRWRPCRSWRRPCRPRRGGNTCGCDGPPCCWSTGSGGRRRRPPHSLCSCRKYSGTSLFWIFLEFFVDIHLPVKWRQCPLACPKFGYVHCRPIWELFFGVLGCKVTFHFEMNCWSDFGEIVEMLVFSAYAMWKKTRTNSLLRGKSTNWRQPGNSKVIKYWEKKTRKRN